MIPSGHKVSEDSKMLKSFGLDQEVISANEVCVVEELRAGMPQDNS